METKCIVQHIGTIEINNGIVVADPCYAKRELSSYGIAMDENEINSGIYDCYIGWVNNEDWGKRVAFMELVLDGENFKLAYGEFLGSCGVDSGTLMMGDRKEWGKHHHEIKINDDWYDKNVVEKCDESAYTFDEGLSFLSSAGFGDGCYDIFGDSDKNNKLVRIMAEFILPEDDEDGFDFVDFIDADSEPNFKWYE